jgi:glucose-1-phosphate thymidylyltransferase
MWPYRAAKELLQVGYETVPPDGRPPRVVPKAAIDHVLGGLQRCGVRATFVVLSPVKWEIFKYLGCGSHLGMRLAYLCQEEPRGMPDAIDLAYPFARDATVCMGMPDTITEPGDCFARLLAFHKERRADLSLGIFAVDDPRSLAPVVLDPVTFRVRDIVDKPEVPPAGNAWGIAVWSPAFSDLLHDFVAMSTPDDPTESLLSDAFLLAVRSGLRVLGLPFESGGYHDIGSPANLIRARQRFDLATLE